MNTVEAQEHFQRRRRIACAHFQHIDGLLAARKSGVHGRQISHQQGNQNQPDQELLKKRKWLQEDYLKWQTQA